MKATWESIFSTWASAPGKTETDRIENAISAIKKALAGDAQVASIVKVFVQGSYRNRVNVRQDSDIDIGVLYTGNSFFDYYPAGKTRADFGNVAGDYTYSAFKDAVGRALISRFGADHVTRGDKAFDIHENTYRVDADVVPLFPHRRYSTDGSYICGVQLNPDSGGSIVNWPERLYDTHEWSNQHYENGNAKNTRTARSYRAVVRIVKKLRNLMDAEGIPEAKPLKGFNVECLVWNAPDNCFMQSTRFDDVSSVLSYLSVHLSSMSYCSEWGEVSELKYLLKGDETKRENFKRFVDRARRYAGMT